MNIPHIFHLYLLYIGGEKSVMWRNFRFQYMTDVEKFEISPHAEEFQIFPHNICGEMWNFAKFGGISHISTWQVWRNTKFTLFCCCKICFVMNYAVFAKSVFARFTRFCVEKNWAKNWVGGEKMTNIRYVSNHHFTHRSKWGFSPPLSKVEWLCVYFEV